MSPLLSARVILRKHTLGGAPIGAVINLYQTNLELKATDSDEVFYSIALSDIQSLRTARGGILIIAMQGQTLNVNFNSPIAELFLGGILTNNKTAKLWKDSINQQITAEAGSQTQSTA